MDTNGDTKELLIKDLSARLPYGVKVRFYNHWEEKYEILPLTAKLLVYTVHIEEIPPYLFPLSSMTEGQKEKLKYLCDWENDRWSGLVVIQENEFCMNTEIIDWLNKNHFDYRGLIPMGLAIDASGKNIY